MGTKTQIWCSSMGGTIWDLFWYRIHQNHRLEIPRARLVQLCFFAWPIHNHRTEQRSHSPEQTSTYTSQLWRNQAGYVLQPDFSHFKVTERFLLSIIRSKIGLETTQRATSTFNKGKERSIGETRMQIPFKILQTVIDVNFLVLKDDMKTLLSMKDMVQNGLDI